VLGVHEWVPFTHEEWQNKQQIFKDLPMLPEIGFENALRTYNTIKTCSSSRCDDSRRLLLKGNDGQTVAESRMCHASTF
jgi:hypothetical protein